ncbi:hypothetical protein GCM10010440_77420 [Kitasatospora cinereorecta]
MTRRPDHTIGAEALGGEQMSPGARRTDGTRLADRRLAPVKFHRNRQSWARFSSTVMA